MAVQVLLYLVLSKCSTKRQLAPLPPPHLPSPLFRKSSWLSIYQQLSPKQKENSVIRLKFFFRWYLALACCTLLSSEERFKTMGPTPEQLNQNLKACSLGHQVIPVVWSLFGPLRNILLWSPLRSMLGPDPWGLWMGNQHFVWLEKLSWVLLFNLLQLHFPERPNSHWFCTGHGSYGKIYPIIKDKMRLNFCRKLYCSVW